MKYFVQVIMSLFFVTSLQVHADSGSDLYMSKGCIGCHGAAGMAPMAPIYPKIGNQNKQYIINQLKDFKNGSRNNGMAAMMTGFVATMTEAEIEALADYLSK
jgi:cytochrome c